MHGFFVDAQSVRTFQYSEWLIEVWIHGVHDGVSKCIIVSRVSGHHNSSSCSIFAVASADKTLNKVWILRKILNQMSTVEAMELLIDKLAKSKDNEDFLKMMHSPT